MQDKLGVTLPGDSLKCEFVGAESEDVALNDLFEWSMRGGGIIETSATPMQVLHQGANGLVPPTAFKKLFFLACLPTYLGANNNLPFLAKVVAARCV